MDLTIKTAAATAIISKYNHQNAYTLPYEENVLKLQSHVENVVVRNSLFNAMEQYSPPTNNLNSSNNHKISNYKRPRLSSETENRSSPNDDSGIDLTPKKLRSSPASECDQTLSQQQQAITNSDNIINSAKRFKQMLEPTTVSTLQLSTITALTHISKEKLSNICAYHGNMVRQFPQKERSAKEQELRNKNTIACRMSRRLKKLAEVAVEEQCKEHEQQLKQRLEQKMRVSAFLVKLMELNGAERRENANELTGEETEQEIDVVSLDDVSSNELPIYGEWKYNESVGKIQWQYQTFVASTSASLMRPNKASDFSIDCLLGH